MSRSRTKNRIVKMMAIDPHCHWCNILCIQIELKYNDKLPDNYPTVDHLYSRFNKKERQEAMLKGIEKLDGYGISYVLACYRCNQDRAIEENTYHLQVKRQRKIANRLSAE